MAGKKNHVASKKEEQEAIEKKDVSFCPLAMPIVAGPGGLAVVLTAANKMVLSLAEYVSITMAIFAVCVIVWICFRESTWVVKILGETGMTAITKIMGFIIIAIAIQMIITGTGTVLADWGIAKLTSG